MSIRGTLSLPSDKSITHRAILFSVLTESKTSLRIAGVGRDNLASLRAAASFGASIGAEGSPEFLKLLKEEEIEFSPLEPSTDRAAGAPDRVVLETLKPYSKRESGSSKQVYCGNSGTTARLLCGLAAGLGAELEISGDKSLSARPFKRIREPLSKMGAELTGDKLPLVVKPGAISGITWESPVASAQVKSAILLAGLAASGETTVIEPRKSRDHTERMLLSMGASLESSPSEKGWKVNLKGPLPQRFLEQDIEVPGDFSAAAFFIVAGLVTPDSELKLIGVGINPTRIGLYKALVRMGGDLEFLNEREVAGEPVADIVVRSSNLVAIETEELEIVDGIDEVPILALACAFAEGESIISKASELRVKECDRLKYMAMLLGSVGVEVLEKDDGLVIQGKGAAKAWLESDKQDLLEDSFWKSGSWMNSHDHRIEMCASTLASVLFGSIRVSDSAAIETSFPGFEQCFTEILS